MCSELGTSMNAIQWLLDSDLASRWQTMRDLTERESRGAKPLEYASSHACAALG